MGAAQAYEGLVVRLEGGKSGRRELHLDGGRPHLPFAVGERGDWKVQAALPGGHVMIAYNGIEVFVAVIGSTRGIEINGAAAASEWTSPELPVVVAFGDARIVIDQEHASEDEITTSPVAHSVRLPRAEARINPDPDTEEDQKLSLALAATSARAPFKKLPPRIPPPLPSPPQIRLITKPWDKS